MRDYEERRWFIKTWVEYMKAHTNSDWSRQQNVLINSVMKTSDQSKERYLDRLSILERLSRRKKAE